MQSSPFHYGFCVRVLFSAQTTFNPFTCFFPDSIRGEFLSLAFQFISGGCPLSHVMVYSSSDWLALLHVPLCRLLPSADMLSHNPSHNPSMGRARVPAAAARAQRYRLTATALLPFQYPTIHPPSTLREL